MIKMYFFTMFSKNNWVIVFQENLVEARNNGVCSNEAHQTGFGGGPGADS